MDKKEHKKRPVNQKPGKGNVKRKPGGTSSSANPNRKKGNSSQKRKTTSRSNSHLSYQRPEQPKKKKRRKMSKRERYFHIAVRWTIFIVVVILLLCLIGKGISFAFHAITGGNKKEQNVQEVTTSQEVETTEETSTQKKTSKKKKKSNKPIEITISAVGDTTLGTDETFGYEGTFTQVYDNVQDPEYFFANVKSIFEADNLTIANLEGALTWSVDMQGEENSFSGKPQYAKILSAGSVEAVDLANDHTMDYGEAGYNDTIEYLAQTGVKSFGKDKNLVMDVNDVSVGLLGVNATGTELDAYKEQVTSGIAELKEEGAQLIIASFHWGIEKSNEPTEMQQTLAHLAIDSGADLVLGHNPHVLQGIEEYNGRNIVYSLGNFCYGANANPSDRDTMIYQQTFTVTGDKIANDLVTNIIPCKVSSSETGNNYQPTPVEGEEKDQILAKIEEYSSLIGKDKTEASTETSSETTESTETSEEETFQ